MSYKNSIGLLPEELIEQIQQYVVGKVIYIPKKQENKKSWGENTDTKQFLALCNSQICFDFKSGMSIQQISKKYFNFLKNQKICACFINICRGRAGKV